MNKVCLTFILSLVIFCFFISPANAATYTVTKTSDTTDGTCDADCSFREAVTAANNNGGSDNINFNIPTSDGGYNAGEDFFLINSASATDISLTDNSGVFIDGYTQSGAIRNTSTFGETLNTKLMIQLYLSHAEGQIQINSNNNHIAGINFRVTSSASIFSTPANSNNWLEGNFFGSNITGTAASNEGTVTFVNTTDSIFGTNGDGSADEGERNLFIGDGSSNNGRLYLQAGSDNVIAGNYFGVDKTGRACASGNKNRQQVNLAGTNNRVGTNYDGTSDLEEANIIACINANARGQIRLDGSINSYIQGNYIGTNPHGDNLNPLVIPGIVIRDAAATDNIVKGNTIAFNGGAGIENRFSTSTSNTFTQNKIYSNGSLGIDNANNGITANDSGDADTGQNDLMNFPVLKKITREGSNLTVIADLDFNQAEGPFTIELFTNDSIDTTGYGEGQFFIGSVSTSTMGTDVTFTIPITGTTPDSAAKLTSTATNASGSTSEFSTTPIDTTLHVISTSNQSSNTSSRSFECNDAAPTSVPDLFQINAAHDTATLYFTPAGNPHSYYYLAYGYSYNDERFGAQLDLGHTNGVMNFTVEALAPNTTYYFKIRGGNGCMPGEWSKTLKVRTDSSRNNTELIYYQYYNVIERVNKLLTRTN